MTEERVTLRDVYDATKQVDDKLEERLKEVPTRREMKLWIALGLVSGQTVASLVTAYVTHLSPPEQVTAIAQLLADRL